MYVVQYIVFQLMLKPEQFPSHIKWQNVGDNREGIFNLNDWEDDNAIN